jgi:sporulation protein YlmC with PRC-barrel domain
MALAVLLGYPGFVPDVGAEETPASSPSLTRASSLITLPVKDAEGQTLGRVKDIVLSRNHRQVESFALAMDASAGGEPILAERAAVSLAPDRRAVIYQPALGQEPMPEAQTGQPEAADPLLSMDAEPPAGDALAASGEPGKSRYVSNLLKLELRDTTGESVGKIRDLLVDLRTGDVVNATVAVGGILGMGEKLATVGWPAVTIQFDQKFASVPMPAAEIKEMAYEESEYWEHLGFSGSEQLPSPPSTTP